MNWAQLPVAGGIYAQHPRLIDDFVDLFEAQAKYQKEQEQRAKDRRPGKKIRGR